MRVRVRVLDVCCFLAACACSVQTFKSTDGVLFVSYYIIVEVFPAVVMLHYLRRRPPSLVQFRNHRINTLASEDDNTVSSSVADLMNVSVDPLEANLLGFRRDDDRVRAAVVDVQLQTPSGGGVLPPGSGLRSGTRVLSSARGRNADVLHEYGSPEADFVSADFGTPTRPSERVHALSTGRFTSGKRSKGARTPHKTDGEEEAHPVTSLPAHMVDAARSGRRAAAGYASSPPTFQQQGEEKSQRPHGAVVLRQRADNGPSSTTPLLSRGVS